MRQIGAGGFPSFVLESDDARQLLDLSAFLGRPEALLDWLRTTLAT